MDRPTSRFRSAPHMPLAQSVWTGNCIAYIVPKLGVPAHLLPMVPHCVAPDRTPFRVVVEWDRNLALLGAGTRPRVAGSSDMPLEGLEGHTHTLAPHTCSGSGGEGPTRPKFGEIYAGPRRSNPPGKARTSCNTLLVGLIFGLGSRRLSRPPRVLCRPPVHLKLLHLRLLHRQPCSRTEGFQVARGATHSQLAAAHSPFASAVAADPFLGERRGGAC